MDTQVLPVSQENIKRAADLLLHGQVVAFPTETVYGLGAWAFHPDGIKRIYEAKGRPSDNPLIIHVAPGILKKSFPLEGIAASVPEAGYRLMKRFWPGPLTLIFPKDAHVPDQVTGKLPTVGVRMPSHPAAIAFLEGCGLPVAAPSANLSGSPSPTTAGHVFHDLQGRIPLILDGGECSVGLESTIVDLTEEVPVILRPGAVTLEMLQDTIGEVHIDPAVLGARSIDAHLVPKAPGMKYRHYAPKGYLIVTDAADETLFGWVQEDLQNRPDERIGIIASHEKLQALDHLAAGSGTAFSQNEHVCMIDLGSRSDYGTIARRLFEALREADETGCTRIFGEAFERAQLGEAIMNRFLKAAAERRLG